MKRSRVEAFVVTILLALPVVLVVEALFFPGVLGASLVPIGTFCIALWLNTYRTSKKPDTQAIRG